MIHGGSCLRAVSTRCKVENATLLRCKLKSVIARVIYHPPQILSRNKILLLQVEKKIVEKSRRQFNFLQRAASICNNEILLRDNV